MARFTNGQKRGMYVVTQLSADAVNVLARSLFDEDRQAAIEAADLLIDALDTLLRELAPDDPKFMHVRTACAHWIESERQ